MSQEKNIIVTSIQFQTLPSSSFRKLASHKILYILFPCSSITNAYKKVSAVTRISFTSDMFNIHALFSYSGRELYRTHTTFFLSMSRATHVTRTNYHVVQERGKKKKKKKEKLKPYIKTLKISRTLLENVYAYTEHFIHHLYNEACNLRGIISSKHLYFTVSGACIWYRRQLIRIQHKTRKKL